MLPGLHKALFGHLPLVDAKLECSRCGSPEFRASITEDPSTVTILLSCSKCMRRKKIVVRKAKGRK